MKAVVVTSRPPNSDCDHAFSECKFGLGSALELLLWTTTALLDCPLFLGPLRDQSQENTCGKVYTHIHTYIHTYIIHISPQLVHWLKSTAFSSVNLKIMQRKGFGHYNSSDMTSQKTLLETEQVMEETEDITPSVFALVRKCHTSHFAI